MQRNTTLLPDAGTTPAETSLVAAAHYVASVYSRVGDADCAMTLIDALASSIVAGGVATIRQAETDFQAVRNWNASEASATIMQVVKDAQAEIEAIHASIPSNRKLGVVFAKCGMLGLLPALSELDDKITVLGFTVGKLHKLLNLSEGNDPAFYTALHRARKSIPETSPYDNQTLASKLVMSLSSNLLPHMMTTGKLTGEDVLNLRMSLAATAIGLDKTLRLLENRLAFIAMKARLPSPAREEREAEKQQLDTETRGQAAAEPEKTEKKKTKKKTRVAGAKRAPAAGGKRISAKPKNTPAETKAE